MQYQIPLPPFFQLNQIFNCGQCFRFEPHPNATADRCIWHGVAHGRYLCIEQTKDSLIFEPCSEEDFLKIWQPFFGLCDDYDVIRQSIDKHFNGHPIMRRAMEHGSGIRILRQDPHEALISFIISQNNNIPRIKKIISTLCADYGSPILYKGNTFFGFPSAKALEDAGIDALYERKTGFRAKYIYDAAKKENSGDIDLHAIGSLPSDDALCRLKTIMGVGDKVANCVLLYGLSHFDAFPIDVWIKKVIAKYFPEGLDISSLGPWAGIAQQYLFYFEKYILSQNMTD